MKFATKFSTIFIAIVTLTACQATFDPFQTDSSRDPAEVSMPAPITPIVLPAFTGKDVQVAVGTDDEGHGIDVPAPLPTAGHMPAGDLWDRIRGGFVLDHHLDEPRVKAELAWFVRHPDYLDRVASRASRHLFHIVEAVEERGLPMEIALLPVVESAFDPFAYSHGRASGLWQFIPGTARRFGLDIDYWYDGRRDVPEATRAALDYLEVLHRFLGDDWLLALAAYNSGEGNVRYAVRKNERSGRSTDFWSLDLLRETEGYVPRLLAISALVADPAAHGVELLTIKNQPYWEVAETGGQIDLARVAELADVSTEELYLLNPGYNKWSTRPEGPHSILLPAGKAAPFESAVASLSQQDRLKWIRHRIKSGESLGLIAARYGTTIDTLRMANKLRSNLIRAGDSLLVPTASEPSRKYELSETERLKRRQDWFEDKTGREPSIHVVQSGDSFWLMSRRYGVGMRELARWNGMGTTDTLFPGQELKLYLDEPIQLAAVDLPVENPVIRRINYRVRRGESLSLIANRFNVSVREIQNWNEDIARQKYLQPGDRITLFVDVTDTD